MPNNLSSRRQLIPYKDLFFGLEADQLPSFGKLDELEFPLIEADQDLPDEVAKAIDKELKPIYDICRGFKYVPMIIEFSLISDTRLLGQDAEHHFSSYMAFFLKDGRSMARAYTRALQKMGSDEAGGEQIVPHPALFSPNTGLIALDRTSLTPRLRNMAVPGAPVPVPHLSAMRQTFKLIEDPKYSLEDRVQTFLGMFLENIKEEGCLADEATMIERTLFLLLPFVRPHFLSSALPLSGDVDRAQYRGYPAGSLFLFLQPEDGAPTKEELARALSWLLAESSLRESYATYAVEQSWKRAFVTYSLAHPLKHRLGDLASDTRWLLESYDYNTPDFASRLRTHQRLVETVHSFAQLCHVLHYAVVHGPEATLRAQDTEGKLKFGIAGPLDFTRLLIEASESSALASRVNRKLELDYSDDFAPVVHGFFRVEALDALVRLKEDLYREIVFEILGNAFRHGRANNDIVKAVASLEDIRGNIAIILSNSVAEAVAQRRLGEPLVNWTSWRSESPTGLTFVASTLGATGAGDLFYRHERMPENGRERRFSVGLVLRGLRNSAL